MTHSQPAQFAGGLGVFPSSLVFETFLQHSRWLLSSLATSVALTGSSPFKNIKTGGLIVDDIGEPIQISKTHPDVDPLDLIEGTVKMSGERKHGFGIDTMRVWAISNDQDKPFQIS